LFARNHGEGAQDLAHLERFTLGLDTV
jgi:hypothetical protein